MTMQLSERKEHRQRGDKTDGMCSRAFVRAGLRHSPLFVVAPRPIWLSRMASRQRRCVQPIDLATRHGSRLALVEVPLRTFGYRLQVEVYQARP